jgi:hypothetical protein
VKTPELQVGYLMRGCYFEPGKIVLPRGITIDVLRQEDTAPIGDGPGSVTLVVCHWGTEHLDGRTSQGSAVELDDLLDMR